MSDLKLMIRYIQVQRVVQRMIRRMPVITGKSRGSTSHQIEKNPPKGKDLHIDADEMWL